ncbi:MAG: hypothetical protein BZY87_01175 [SAR202 cluster bacterium Io17-Chloro-G6]|nr:MAG: hypothetical protein BZY87_01175 [SAR202 cluster bacterium Io17-Chloro-G6]
MGFYVYILRCSDGSYYTGHTDNIQARLAAHQSGQIFGYTYERRPVKLAFVEELGSRDDAFRRERQIKGWSRSKKEALMANDWERLVELSRSMSWDPK